MFFRNTAILIEKIEKSACENLKSGKK